MPKEKDLSFYDSLIYTLRNQSHKWLITGVAGFIGSNILKKLLDLDQVVIGIDNFSTGYQKNLDQVQGLVKNTQWKRFSFIEGDICNFDDCMRVCGDDIEFILHQAALGSVPRSIKNPIQTNKVNIQGFLNMLEASRIHRIKKFVYAASSSTYGDHTALPKREDIIGEPLSPYAVTKYVNEIYAKVYARCYGFDSIGLRYFNVFGPRQSPKGEYAAVVPKWLHAMINEDELCIYGDGNTSRDFCYVDNAVQANLISAFNRRAGSHVYNIAFGERNTLNQLFDSIREELAKNGVFYKKSPIYQDFRIGDIAHSHASIERAVKYLGYSPKYSLKDGIHETVNWILSSGGK